MQKERYSSEVGKALRFVTDFARSIQVRKMYPPEHPFIEESVVKAYKALMEALEEGGAVSFGVSPVGFFVMSEEIKNPPPVCRDVANMMRRMGLDTIIFHHGIDQGEVAAFANELAELDRKALKGEKVAIDPDDVGVRYPHVEVNAFKWERVTTKETKILEKVKEKAEELGEDELKVVDYLLGGSGEGADIVGAVVVGLLDEAPERLVEMIQEAVVRAGVEKAEGVVYEMENGEVGGVGKAAQTIFDRIATALVAGGKQASEQVEDAFFKILQGLPPSTLKALFGEGVTAATQEHAEAILKTLSRRVRARILLNDLLREYSDVDMERIIRKVVKYGSEMAEIAELLSKELQHLSSRESRERALTRLMHVLRADIEGRVIPRYNALVVEPDQDMVTVYRAALYEHSCAVKSVESGEAAMEALENDGFDLVVMELRLKGAMTGHELLMRLRRRGLPVLIATEVEGFKHDFEVATYPTKRFLVKPVSIEDVKKAVDELLGEVRGEEIEQEVAGPVDEEELKEAEEIQKSLLPKELPRVEGFHFAAAYAPCKGVGGDIYDVVELADGRVGIFVGDVSGKGISAAMVMVMVRTLFRTVAAFHESPRQALIHLNRLLSREMAESMFVSAVYVIVDPKRHELSLSCAGHCPPLFWATERDNVVAQFVSDTGMVMGLGDTEFFHNKTKEFLFQVDPGVGLLLYTDGITEALNNEGKQFGEERLLDVITASGLYEPERILANIYSAVDLFRGERPQSDDMTVFCIKCTG